MSVDAAMVFKILGVVAYLSVLLVIGFQASKRMKNMRDYFAAGKNLSFWSVAFSARATGESGWLLLGLTGMGAMIGWRGFWVVLGEVLGVMGAWLLMSRRFKRLTDKYDAITIPDYLEARFQDSSQQLRKVAAATLVVFVTIYVAAQIFATGTAFHSFLGLNYYVGVLIGFGVVLVYSVSGGFVAVVWSDIFQGVLMFFGLVALPIIGLVLVGGVGAMNEGLGQIDPALLTLSGAEGWTALTVCSTLGLTLIGLGFMGSPQIFVRFLALRDESEIASGAWVAFVWTLLADSGAVLTGMVGRVLLTRPGQDVERVLGKGAEDVLPMLVEGYLPAILVGLFIAIVLSAIMSTADSLLVVASSAIVRDWVQQIHNPSLRDEDLVSMSRKVTLGLAVVSLMVTFVATTPGQTVFWFVIFGWSGIAATFCPTMILSLFWKGMTKNGALAAMISGFACVPFAKFAVPHFWPDLEPWVDAITVLPPAFLLSGLMGIAVSLMDVQGRKRLADVDLLVGG